MEGAEHAYTMQDNAILIKARSSDWANRFQDAVTEAGIIFE